VSSRLAELLFKDYRRRTLGLLLLHPDKRYHVREIARLTGTVAGTLHKELAKQADAGLLVKESVGNQVQYQANLECPIYEELASILRKTVGVVDVLANALFGLLTRIDVAFVFGSIASGKAKSGSDVDLMVVGDVGFSEVVSSLHPAEGILRREINPKIFSHIEWQLMREKNDPFFKEVMEKPKLFVIGDKNELG